MAGHSARLDGDNRPTTAGAAGVPGGRFDTAIQYWIALAPADPQVRSALAEAYYRGRLPCPRPLSALPKEWYDAVYASVSPTSH
ncbi:MAG: hypothetical protein HC828_15910 [Blastochloris sp.]|nr:hypothetical protein [Blastochloris sp.]